MEKYPFPPFKCSSIYIIKGYQLIALVHTSHELTIFFNGIRIFFSYKFFSFFVQLVLIGSPEIFTKFEITKESLY